MDDELAHSWTDGMSAAKRVEAVARTVGEPRTANWIATEAEVAHETATKYLSRLVEDGKLRSDTRGQQIMYEPDPVGQYLLEVRELYDDYSPDDLAASLEDITEQLQTWKAAYDVETPNELRASLARTAAVTDERERRHVAREWDHLRSRRRLIEDALRLYDRFPSERPSASA